MTGGGEMNLHGKAQGYLKLMIFVLSVIFIDWTALCLWLLSGKKSTPTEINMHLLGGTMGMVHVLSGIDFTNLIEVTMIFKEIRRVSLKKRSRLISKELLSSMESNN